MVETREMQDRSKSWASASFLQAAAARSAATSFHICVGRGHKVLNLDLLPLDLPGVNTMIVDLADSGKTFNALSTHFDFGEDLRAGKGAASARRRRALRRDSAASC